MDFEFTNKPEPNFPREGLTFVGLVSLIDPPRETVKGARELAEAALRPPRTIGGARGPF